MRLRATLATVAAVVLALVAAPALADTPFPELDVTAFDQALGHQTQLDFEFTLLESAQPPETITLSEPAGYATALTAPTGDTLGDAEVDTIPAAGGSQARYTGSLVTGLVGLDAAVAACAPGTHAGGWHLVVNGPTGSVSVPILIDQADEGTYRFTICLDAFRAASLKPIDVWFAVHDVFQNPQNADTYHWSALVTPANAAGAADPTTAFELRADEPLPETLSAAGAYAKKQSALVVRGVLKAAGSVRSGIRVHVFAGSSLAKLQEVGVAVTTRNGSYVFLRRLAKAPKYVGADVHHYHYQGCDQPSTAPGGCSSQTIDGVVSTLSRVTVVTK